jgi:carboxypeptidase Q
MRALLRCVPSVLLGLLVFRATRGAEPFPQAPLDQARAIRERALSDDTAYELLRSLTTEVGPRSAGSPGDARAVGWALGRLRALGFKNVRAESVTVSHWIRGEAHAEITAPWPQTLLPVALGGSGATPPEGVETEVVPITSLAELAATPAAAVRGRIVFFTQRMQKTHDGAGYGTAVAVRSTGALESSRRGAVAIVIRSIGTDGNRLAHTGGMRIADSVRTIPALAISNPDADLLENELASGRPVRVRLRNSSAWGDSARSANVIAEVPGAARAGEVVLLGAHLDSWDLGTGAQDDGAGVATVIAAARLIGEARVAPARTVRVVLYANEEHGGQGSRAYVRRHGDEVARHVMAMESDLGAFQVLGVESRVPLDRLPVVRAMASLLAPWGAEFLGNEADGGSDVGPLGELGVPLMDVRTDAVPYFDLHHTANDTFDKIDPALLRQNVAAYATLAYLAAQYPGDFGRAAKPKPAR